MIPTEALRSEHVEYPKSTGHVDADQRRSGQQPTLPFPIQIAVAHLPAQATLGRDRTGFHIDTCPRTLAPPLGRLETARESTSRARRARCHSPR